MDEEASEISSERQADANRRAAIADKNYAKLRSVCVGARQVRSAWQHASAGRASCPRAGPDWQGQCATSLTQKSPKTQVRAVFAERTSIILSCSCLHASGADISEGTAGQGAGRSHRGQQASQRYRQRCTPGSTAPQPLHLQPEGELQLPSCAVSNRHGSMLCLAVLGPGRQRPAQRSAGAARVKHASGDHCGHMCRAQWLLEDAVLQTVMLVCMLATCKFARLRAFDCSG